ncbi:MAG: right-handed parallel beta-helix repeat-containing protein, partial [Candidatus Woesearchaeota archaeon]|nr:right-handed parallel beta-helix repeat-containing protein [Candidatus Woesearchaeota archaeon]
MLLALLVLLCAGVLVFLSGSSSITGFAAAGVNQVTIYEEHTTAVYLGKYFANTEQREFKVMYAVDLTVEIEGSMMYITPKAGFEGKQTIELVSGADKQSFVVKVIRNDESEPLPSKILSENETLPIGEPETPVNDTETLIDDVVEVPENESVMLGVKKLGRKIQDEPEFDVNFTDKVLDNETLTLIFYHNSNDSQPVYVVSDVEFELSSDTAAPFENVSLVVTLDDGIVPEFELHVGDTSEAFKFGKKIPKVDIEGKKVKKCKNKDENDNECFNIIDRDDDFVDVLISKENASVYLKRVNVSDIRALFNWISSTVLTTEVFAAEPIDMEEAVITLPRTDDVTAIVECSDFDFDFKSCMGDWVVTDVPFNKTAENVTFTVTHFSGYGGGNIAVINVQSYPTLFGNWTVRFNTTGTANLTITVVNTTWTDYAEDGYDLKFLELNCGNQTLNYTWTNNSVFIEDYYCNETGFEISKVLTEGKHVLEFRFGDDVDYAYNTATYMYVGWSQTFNRGWNDYGYGIATDSQNNVVVTGASIIGVINGYATVKYNSDGVQQWNRTFDVGTHSMAHAIAIDTEDNVIVTGQANGNYFTIKYDSDGNHIWNNTYNSGGNDDAYGVATDSENSVIVTGYKGTDYFTIKYDSTGEYWWDATFTAGYNAYAIATDTLNNVIVTGYGGNGNYLTVKYDSNGNYQWNKSYTGTSAQAYGVATDSANNVIVTGSDNSNYRTIKYDSNGNHVWNNTYDSGGADTGRSVATDPSNNIIVTGVANGNYFTIKYDSNGNALWNATYASGTAYGVDTDRVDNIIVTGTVSNNYYTIKYLFSSPPTQSNPILNSTDGTNRTSQNLTVYPQNVNSTNNLSSTNITNWYRNGSSYAVLNMPFDTNSSTTAKYYTSYNNTGTVSGPTWTSSGISGGAYSFDGVNDYIGTSYASSLNITGPMTVEVWINTTSLTPAAQYIADRWTYTPGNFRAWSLDLQTTSLVWRASVDGTDGGVKQISYDYTGKQNQWHHIVGTYNGTNLTLYVDGSQAAIGAGPASIVSSNKDIYIGGGDQGLSYPFNGTMDEVRIYNRALTSQEISADYNSGAPKYDKMVSEELSIGDAWYCEVTPNNGYEDGNATMSNGVQVGNAPTQGTPIANASSTNITVYPQSVSDIDGNSVINITNWLKNGNSITVLNMPFDGLTSRHSVVTNEVGAWYFENNMKDFSGYGNSGSCTNCPAYLSAGKVDGAYDFDGTNDAVRIPYNQNLAMVGKDFTIASWIYMDAEPDDWLGSIFSKATGGAGVVTNGYVFSIRGSNDGTNKNKLWANIMNATGFIESPGNTVLSVNKWYHAVMTYSYSTRAVNFYLNGQPDGGFTSDRDITDSGATSVTEIGRGVDYDGYAFNGKIDEVHVFNRSLSVTEIKTLYKKGAPPQQTVDYSSYGNTGTVSGATWTSSGISGGAYSFDGVNDYINVSDSSTLEGMSRLTVEFWMKANTLDDWAKPVSKTNWLGYSNTSYYCQVQDTDAFQCGVFNETGGGFDTTTTTVITTNTWYHVASVMNGTYLLLYINGILNDSKAFVGSSVYKTDWPVMIGGGLLSTAPSNFFNGTVDEVRIYNKSLSAQQIAADYNAGVPKYSTIVSQEYATGGTWSAESTPNDGYMDGTTNTSNGVTIVSACGTIITGDAILISNLTQVGAGNCIEFGANNIQLDCNGFSITGDSSGGSYGVRVNGRSGVTIKNCKLNKFEIGMYVTSMSNSIVDNNEINGSGLIGIYHVQSVNNNITSNKINNTGTYDSITLVASNDTLIQDNTIYVSSRSNIWIEGQTSTGGSYRNTVKNNVMDQAWNTYGIGLYNAGAPVQDNILQNNTVKNVTSYPIYLYSANNNRFENNIINQSYWNGFSFTNSYGNNVTNTTWDNIVVYSLMLNDETSFNNKFEGSPSVPRYVYLSGNNGLLQFRDAINLSASTNFANTSIFYIANNKLFVNTTARPGFNVTFLAQLAGVYWANYRTIIQKDSGDTGTYTSCLPPNCNISWFGGGRVEWMANGFSNYRLGNNTAPTQGTPVLNASYVYNTTKSNLTVYNQSTNDADGHAVENVINWYRNATSITVLNLPFDFQSTDLTGSDTAKTYDFSGYSNTGSLTTGNQTLIDSCDTNTSWNCYNAPAGIVNTTIDKVQGTASLTPTKGDTTNTDFFCQKAITVNLTNQFIGVWVYIKNSTVLSKINRFQIYLAKDVGYSAYEWKDFSLYSENI